MNINEAVKIEKTEEPIIQFNWKKNWRSKVKPHLTDELVRFSLNLGMKLLDEDWEPGDPPWQLGNGPVNGQRARPGGLSWYQPWGRCHWIAFFSMAIGVKNYPDCDWRFITGDLHTVPVGCRDGQPQVVMDILNFAYMTGKESMACAQIKSPRAVQIPEFWPKLQEAFINGVVPKLKGAA